ncbi:DUF3305 domain-containing protein [Herminiimonas fonticola]|uniref:Uncharacterized protein DUF3305 n=1 Tax=Herminiimonas fonticola TaxID=303380 RepID=A0A4R6G6X4_9BURK|nr:DUF3305 domain-containing protein [Herminiimonas fonticola]RBA24252.1 Protein of unknown function (DUF3305) [Herminiimonas fonticola]TDN90253.1 uncharacterized protein DUF3305 [Herminiimonas fonticola]
METEAIRIGVIMQCTPLSSRWQPFQWLPIEIVGQVPELNAPRCLRNDPADTRWLFNGIDVTLCSSEAEGYFLNISAPVPCWFIMWRIEDIDGVELAVPKSVTLSYNEAARLMDGGERVDTLPASAEIVERLTAFTHDYYHPEPKRKHKKPSFEGGEGVAKMARAEGDHHGG